MPLLIAPCVVRGLRPDAGTVGMCAIALQTGRPKDYLRIHALIESGHVQSDRLAALVNSLNFWNIKLNIIYFFKCFYALGSDYYFYYYARDVLISSLFFSDSEQSINYK